MFFCTVYACIYVVVLFENVVVNVSERFERCWDSDVLLSHAENFPQTSFSLMFHLVLVQLVVGSVISYFYYTLNICKMLSCLMFSLWSCLPCLGFHEDLRHTSACDRGKLF